MKKVIGLCLVLLISSVSVFAQDGKRRTKKGGDPAQRCEKMIADLKLNEKQAVDFRKVEAEFRDKMKAERKQADSDRRKMREKMITMRNERDAEIKKIMTLYINNKNIKKQRSMTPLKVLGPTLSKHDSRLIWFGTGVICME